MNAILELNNFGIAYGERIVLANVDLHVPERGIVSLVGPAGTGKSTLLRSLAGFNRHIPSLRAWGDAKYEGKPLDATHFPVLVSQNTKLLTSTLLENLLYSTQERFAATPEEKRKRAMANLERVGLSAYEHSLSKPVVELPLVVQRLVAITRVLATNPKLLLLDEPTFGLDDVEAEQILAVIRKEGQERAVLVVSHHKGQAQSLGGQTVLLAGGVVQEAQSTEKFFTSPITIAGKEWLASGQCSEPSPGANPDDVTTGVRARLRPLPPDAFVPSQSIGPYGFVWLLPGKLAGTPMPGIVSSLEYDLEALKRVGVTVLISLRASTAVKEESLKPYGMATYWFPIPDMHAPSIECANEICALIDSLLERGATVAVHCRAGLGRTGTILVAYLIWRGQSAMDALETARRYEPKWVQSDAQVKFLEAYAASPRTRAERSSSDLPALRIAG